MFERWKEFRKDSTVMVRWRVFDVYLGRENWEFRVIFLHRGVLGGSLVRDCKS